MSLDLWMKALTAVARLTTACSTVKLWRDSRAIVKGLAKVMLAKEDREHYTLIDGHASRAETSLYL